MPTSEVVVSFGLSVIGLLGGGGVILAAVCAYLSKFIADRTIEGHKTTLNSELERLKSELSRESDLHKLKLRKAEILFERELKSASEFFIVHRKITPQYSYPDMDWGDACDDVAKRLSTIESQLQKYLDDYAPFLTESIRDKIRSCSIKASHNKFFEYGDSVNKDAHDAAGEIMTELNIVEDEVLKMVRNETRD